MEIRAPLAYMWSQDDIGVDEIRKLMPDKIIGLSIRNEENFNNQKS